MSLSTPYPPPKSHPDPEHYAFVTDLHSVADFTLALESAAHETVSCLGADGRAKERPMLVIVEGYARSCRACIGVKRVYEKISEEYKASVRCYRFDAFTVPKLSQQLGLRAMPTFILFKNGKRIDHFSASSRQALEQNIIDNL
jgi:thioredoxin 1